MIYKPFRFSRSFTLTQYLVLSLAIAHCWCKGAYNSSSMILKVKVTKKKENVAKKKKVHVD